MKALYESYCAGCPSPLPELPIQYADFALWQRQWLQDEVVDKQLAYWKDRLAGAPNLMQLPCDYSRPAVQTFRGSFRRVVFPIPLLESFKALSQNEQATLFMTLLAATSVLLGRFTGQDDVLMGTPIAGRNRPET